MKAKRKYADKRPAGVAHFNADIARAQALAAPVLQPLESEA